MKAALQAAEALEADHDAALAQWRLQVERARYEAERAERRYRQVEPEHRLVARGLERDWEKRAWRARRGRGRACRCASASARARSPPEEREQLLALGSDLGRVWSAPTTTDRDRKQLLRCLIEEVILDVDREERRATLTLRWRGGALTELAVPLPKPQPAIRTDEDTIALLERLAAHYDDATIAGILNRQGRRSATGERFTEIIVGGLRRYRNIPAYKPPAEPPDGELLPVGKAAEELGVAPSTHLPLAAGRVHRRRAGHPRRPLADPRQRPAPRTVRRRRTSRLRSDRRRDAYPRRLPPDRVAACKARRAPGHPRPQRTTKRPANTGPTGRIQPCLTPPRMNA